jgi:arylsulfatase
LSENEISVDKAVKVGDRTYKNYLDGYNQMDAITGKAASQ